MTQRQFTIEWNDEEVRTFGITRMSTPDGQGYQFKADVSRNFNLLDKYGNTIGTCWGYGVRGTPEEAWEAALQAMRNDAEAMLAERNRRGPPQQSKGLEAETIVAKKSAEDMGL